MSSDIGQHAHPHNMMPVAVILLFMSGSLRRLGCLPCGPARRGSPEMFGVLTGIIRVAAPKKDNTDMPAHELLLLTVLVALRTPE